MLEADYHGLYNTSLGREITVSSETGVQLCGKFIDYFAVENGFGGATLIYLTITTNGTAPRRAQKAPYSPLSHLLNAEVTIPAAW